MASRSNLVDNILDTQKKVIENVVENTKKFTTGNGNNVLNETIEKGNEWYKNWLESQKSFFTKFAGNTSADNGKAKADTKANDATTGMNDFLQQWFDAQVNWTKQAWEMSQDAAKNFGTNNSNPFASWQANMGNMGNMNNMSNMFNQWNNWMTANNWMNQMQSAFGGNPFNNDAFKKATDSFSSSMNQYYTTLNNNFTEWQKSFENGTVQDAYKNMVNSAEGFTKFAEMWMPMIKSMQEKTFSMDEYKKLMNPELYKEFMDKFFSFMPESSQDYMNKMRSMMNDGMGKMTDAGMNNYNQVRDMMSKYGNGAQLFGNAFNTYNAWNAKMTEAAAPFTKLMPSNQHTKTMQEWSDINNRVMEYNIKNAELQYMIYNQGSKVMDKLAEYTAKKVKNGAEVTSIVDLYQDWLNISDKVFVSLFESNEYSELMAEVSAMQMKLRKDIDGQTEKLLKDIPVATRSEMDEVYQTIYELKKKVRQLEKMLDIEGEDEAPAKPAAKKTASKSSSRKR